MFSRCCLFDCLICANWRTPNRSHLFYRPNHARPPLPAAVGSRGIGRRFVLSSCNRISTKRGKQISAYLIAEHIITDEAKFHEYTPKGDQECSNCSLFQEPNSCTLYETIYPATPATGTSMTISQRRRRRDQSEGLV